MIESIWTEEMVTRLINRFYDGLTYGNIAKEFGVTRNTVCGKIARLQLHRAVPRVNEMLRQQRAIDRREKHNEKQRLRRARVKAGLPPIERPVIMPFMGSLDIPFAQLTDFKKAEPNQCRYIAAEPAGPDYLACGNPTKPGASWCVHHSAIVLNRPISMSDQERMRRATQAIQNCNSAVVKRGFASEASA